MNYTNRTATRRYIDTYDRLEYLALTRSKGRLPRAAILCEGLAMLSDEKRQDETDAVRKMFGSLCAPSGTTFNPNTK